MNPPVENGTIHGIVAEFEHEKGLLDALRGLRYAGLTELEIYSPTRVDGADEILGRSGSWLPAVIFAAGLAGAVGGFFLQYYGMVIGYPLNIGGRPLNSWPAFGTTTFELCVLLAILVGIGALLVACRLPRPYDPVFEAPGIERASQDRFLLKVAADDPRFDRETLPTLLASYHPLRVAEIPA
jgi:hypothetical protein